MNATNEIQAVIIPDEAKAAHTGAPGRWYEAGILRGGRNGKPGIYDHLSFQELTDLNTHHKGGNTEVRQEHTRRERLMKLEPIHLTPDELAQHKAEIEILLEKLYKNPGEAGNIGPRSYGLQMREWQRRGLTQGQARAMIDTDMMFSG